MREKVKRFVAEYVKDFNGKEAAIRVGYSPNRAPQTAYDLLSNPDVKAAVERESNRRLEAIGVKGERVLREMARIAMSDARNLFKPDGSLKDPSEWDDDTAATVSSVETVEEFAGRGESREQIGFTKKVKMWDKNRSLEMLAKHLKLIGNGDKHKVEIEYGITPEMESLMRAMIEARRGIDRTPDKREADLLEYQS